MISFFLETFFKTQTLKKFNMDVFKEQNYKDLLCNKYGYLG